MIAVMACLARTDADSSIMGPLSSSPWSAPDMVAGFARSSPNAVLIQFAGKELRRAGASRALDIGCGAGRNAVPLARIGWNVLGIDLSRPMLAAAAARAQEDHVRDRLRLAVAPMDLLPARDGSFDLLVAHGIWNLARSGDEFRRAVREAARVARPGAGLFVFTFSRNTLPPQAEPVPGEVFVFTQFSGQPQCFLTERQLVGEMSAAGFRLDPAVPLTEHNLPRAGALASGAPVIYEAAFRADQRYSAA
jgi:SAM-dependent methyltransferase